jgi:hypothetical protein
VCLTRSKQRVVVGGDVTRSVRVLRKSPAPNPPMSAGAQPSCWANISSSSTWWLAVTSPAAGGALAPLVGVAAAAGALGACRWEWGVRVCGTTGWLVTRWPDSALPTSTPATLHTDPPHTHTFLTVASTGLRWSWWLGLKPSW